MGTPLAPPEYILRPASAGEAATIRRMISLVHINPTGLDWRRFLLAVDREGQVIGCGQVKTHADGSDELASIAVLPEWRGKGIARAIIERLLQDHPGILYLTCRVELGPMYQKFGFRTLSQAEMPPYFQGISKLVRLFTRLFRRPNLLLVMRRG